MLNRLLSAGLLAAGLILVAPATPASAAQVSGPLEPQTGTVQGVFTDRSGDPIVHASVYTSERLVRDVDAAILRGRHGPSVSPVVQCSGVRGRALPRIAVQRPPHRRAS